MSSSTFAVTEAENEGEKDLNFGLEACEENGIGLTAQVDGEIQKDHTYTKDPDGPEEEGEKTEESQEEVNETTETLPEKRTSKKTQKVVKKNNPRSAKAKKDSPKKEVSVKKEVPASKKAKTKKDVLTEESNKSDDNTKPEKSEEKIEPEEETKSPKRGSRKRKVEEKENVIDRSIVEEVQNINEGDSVPDVNTESPAKKKKTDTDKVKGKSSKPKTTPVAEDGEDNQNLPEGWVRKVVVRKSGKTAGQIDIYIYSPDGIKFRSRPDIAAYLQRTNSDLKLEYFNFSKKKVSDEEVTKSPVKKEKSTPAVKPKNIPEKKKAQPASSKRGSKLLVKLNFSPKKKGLQETENTNKYTTISTHMCETTRLLKELKEDPVCLCHSDNSDLLEVPSENEFNCPFHKENLKCLKRSKQLIVYNEEGCLRGIELNKGLNSDTSTFNDLQLYSNSIPSQGYNTYVEDSSDRHILSENLPVQNIERNVNFVCQPLYNFDSIDSSGDRTQFPQSYAHCNTKRRGRKRKSINRKRQMKKSVNEQSKKSLSNLQRNKKHSVPCTVLEKQSYTQVSVEEVRVSQSDNQRPRRNITKKTASEMLMLKRKIKKKIVQSTSIEYQEENINQTQYSSSIDTKISVHHNQGARIRKKISKDIEKAGNIKHPKRSQTTVAVKSISRKIKEKAAVGTIKNFPGIEFEKYGPQILPPGWNVLVNTRKSGKTAGQIDIYFYTPEGIKLRSRVELAAYLQKKGLSFSAEEFCFRKTAYRNMLTF